MTAPTAFFSCLSPKIQPKNLVRSIKTLPKILTLKYLVIKSIPTNKVDPELRQMSKNKW